MRRRTTTSIDDLGYALAKPDTSGKKPILMFTMFQIAAGGYGGLIVQTFAVLGGVVLLGWVLTKFVAPRLKRVGSGSRMKIVERMPLEQRKSLYLVEVEGQRLLLGVSDSSINLVSQLEQGERTVDSPALEEETHGR